MGIIKSISRSEPNAFGIGKLFGGVNLLSMWSTGNWHKRHCHCGTLFVEAYPVFHEMIAVNGNKNTPCTSLVRMKPNADSGPERYHCAIEEGNNQGNRRRRQPKEEPQGSPQGVLLHPEHPGRHINRATPQP